MDLEKIKYIVQSAFLDQSEMQVNQIYHLPKICNPLLSLLIQYPNSSDIQLQNHVEKVETSKQYMHIQT